MRVCACAHERTDRNNVNNVNTITVKGGGRQMWSVNELQHAALLQRYSWHWVLNPLIAILTAVAGLVGVWGLLSGTITP